MPCSRRYYVYVLTNRKRTVLYTGMTGNLALRLQRHHEGHGSAFTAQYRVRDLVYVEVYPTAHDAIRREKQIKTWSRAKKLALIRHLNPSLHTLPSTLFQP